MSAQRILLVEDNPDDVELTLRAFRRSPLANAVEVATDGADALRRLGLGGDGETGGQRQLPGLVLLDLQLPKVHGLEVLERLRADPRTRLTPVVILTSSDERTDRLEGYGRGANSYIRKPVDFDQFVEAVRQLGLYWFVLNEPPPAGPGEGT